MSIFKANRRLNLLRLLSGTNWGCKPKKNMQLYKQFVRPVLENVEIALLLAPRTIMIYSFIEYICYDLKYIDGNH